MLSGRFRSRWRWQLPLPGFGRRISSYERHASNAKDTPKEKEGGGATPLNPDYYVTPKKLYPFDLKSARQLTKQPVWVKEGYRYPYYAYNTATHHTDFEHEAGMLLPIQKLSIKDVVLDTAPNGGGQKQVMALFEDGGKTYSFQIGYLKDSEYKILLRRDAIHSGPARIVSALAGGDLAVRRATSSEAGNERTAGRLCDRHGTARPAGGSVLENGALSQRRQSPSPSPITTARR